MSQERLCHLTLMSIESDILNELDLSDIVDDFACRKSRKKCECSQNAPNNAQ